MRQITLIAFFCVLGVFAQPIEQPYRFHRETAEKHFSAADGAYWGSVAFLAAGHIADHNSSVGKYEMNPFLRGTSGHYDSGRGALIKAVVIGGNVVAQRLLIRHNPKAKKWATVVNFALGGVGFAIAARNRGQGIPAQTATAR